MRWTLGQLLRNALVMLALVLVVAWLSPRAGAQPFTGRWEVLPVDLADSAMVTIVSPVTLSPTRRIDYPWQDAAATVLISCNSHRNNAMIAFRAAPTVSAVDGGGGIMDAAVDGPRWS